MPALALAPNMPHCYLCCLQSGLPGLAGLGGTPSQQEEMMRQMMGNPMMQVGWSGGGVQMEGERGGRGWAGRDLRTCTFLL